MIKISQFIILFLIFNTVLAQKNEYLCDDFNNNRFEWKLENLENFSTSIEAGNLIIENNSADSKSIRFVQNLFMYNDSDFIIEAKIDFLSRTKGQHAGLIWHSMDDKNGFYFEINPEGKVHFWANKKGGLFDIMPWKDFPELANKTFYTLKIARKGRDMMLYVNDLQVYTSGYRGQFAYQIGFVCSSNTKIAVDYLLVKHPPVDISDKAVAEKIKKNDLYWILNKAETKTAHIFGKITNENTNELIKNAQILIKNEAGKVIDIKINSINSGVFDLDFPANEKYFLIVKANDYISESVVLDFSSDKGKKEKQINIALKPIEIGKAINLKNVLFERGEAILVRSSYQDLDKLADFMLDNPAIEIELSGYTDNWGNAKLNLELSEKRVQRVKRYLVEKGVSASHITGKGYGGTHAIADNNNEITRKLNRRVEFKITKK